MLHSLAMTQEEMISKREVLEHTDISYGQFYRWKRKGLIPEAWFRRRSTFTGQETFLPRDKVLDRIHRINDLKDDHSLDEIAEILSPDMLLKSYSAAEVGEMAWLSKHALQLYQSVRGDEGTYGFNEIVFIAAVEQLSVDGKLALEQLELAANGLLENFDSLESDEGRYLTIACRSSISYSVVHSGTCYFDRDSDVLASVDLNDVVEEVKLKLEGTI